MPRSRPSLRSLSAATTTLSLLAVTLVPTTAATAQTVQTAPPRCEIVGTPGPDVLIGTDAGEIICGLGGDDIIRGLGGDDELVGGAGNDELIGGAGNDELLGGDDFDALFGGPGDDVLRGGNGDDGLVGGAGDDELRGGNGADSLAGGVGSDELRGGNDNDIVRGADGDDVIFGGPGEDILRGGSGNDRLRGGPDNDICEDSFANTGALDCEFGRGGDDTQVAVGRQLWELHGNTEFVYELSITTPCPDAATCGVPTSFEVIHVLGDDAEGSFGTPAFTAADLFDVAEQAEADGRKVAFDTTLGLPTVLDNADGATLSVTAVGLRDQLRSDYEAALSQWTAEPVTYYSYTADTSCFCPFVAPLRVMVSDGDVTSVGLSDDAVAWTGGALTIDQHLENLGELLDGRVIEVRAEFDERGVPTFVSVNESNRIVDEERSIRISDFVDESPVPATDTPDPVETIEAPAPIEPVPSVPAPEPARETLTIVDVRGIQVAQEIAGRVDALLAAADDAGLVLSGGGFRDPARQIELRKQNCGTTDFEIFELPASQCSPPTARPGQSQHEVGLAIDFTSSGRLVTSRNDPAFIWLATNAGTFGFINLPSEPWHWSTTGN